MLILPSYKGRDNENCMNLFSVAMEIACILGSKFINMEKTTLSGSAPYHSTPVYSIYLYCGRNCIFGKFNGVFNNECL